VGSDDKKVGEAIGGGGIRKEFKDKKNWSQEEGRIWGEKEGKVLDRGGTDKSKYNNLGGTNSQSKEIFNQTVEGSL